MEWLPLVGLLHGEIWDCSEVLHIERLEGNAQADGRLGNQHVTDADAVFQPNIRPHDRAHSKVIAGGFLRSMSTATSVSIR